MTPNELRKACLAHHGAVEDFPFGPETSVFKVAGKIFAISGLDGAPLSVSLKSDPELALSLRAEHPAIQPGYHLNKRHWNTVTMDGSLSEDLVLDMIEDSYDLVVKSLTRAQRADLGA
jgi:predicted DNA-binding protein (MmcQ/YjbR family)